MRGTPRGKVRLALALVSEHPEWVRACADCVKFIYGDNGELSLVPQPGPDGEVLRDVAGQPVMLPQPRPKGVSPPCGACPKTEGRPARVPLADADDPCGESADWVWEVVRGVRGLLAWGQPPPDPVTQAVGVVVAAHDRREERRSLLRAVAQLVKPGR